MLTKDFINTTLPLLNENHRVKSALCLMKEHNLRSVPANINDNYGFFSYDALHLIPIDTPLSKVEQLLSKVHTTAKNHIWNSLSTLNQHGTDTLPILDEEGNFCGNLIGKDILDRILEVFPVGNGGAILELEMSYQNYSIHELGGIVEGANASINQLSIFPIDSTSKIKIVFGINKNDASDVIQALERHSYHVTAWFMNKGKIDNILEERYDAFMKYINV